MVNRSLIIRFTDQSKFQMNGKSIQVIRESASISMSSHYGAYPNGYYGGNMVLRVASEDETLDIFFGCSRDCLFSRPRQVRAIFLDNHFRNAAPLPLNLDDGCGQYKSLRLFSQHVIPMTVIRYRSFWRCHSTVIIDLVARLEFCEFPLPLLVRQANLPIRLFMSPAVIGIATLSLS
jgi:hypothetical protein